MEQGNMNVSWLKSKAAWLLYLLILFGTRFLIWLYMIDYPGWTIVNIGHAIVTYITFHYQKGATFYQSKQKYDSMTFWEQIDNETHFTPTRKFLTIIPILLFLITINGDELDARLYWLNFFALFVVLIAKLPKLHRVRIFGINAE
jgi:hypothetical protein